MGNSSYNLIPILLKLCRHCDHALKICVRLGYTPQINFCCLFSQFELSHFLDIFMPPTSKKLRGHIGLGLSVQSSL